ncbi:7462_t:CDS:2, partial [Paraglomus occultum]
MLETEVPAATLTLMPDRRDIHASTMQVPTLELPTEARNQEDLFKRSCVYAKKNRNNFNMKRLQQKLSDRSRDRLSETRCIVETETQDIDHTHQNLSTLPDLFLHPPLRLSPLIHLTHLNLSHNQLSSIPPQIGYLHSLRSLDLSNNQITELPCQLATKLSAIETIDVCNNPLATSQIDLVYVSSGVPSLSDLVFRYLVNKDYRFINSKNGELPNVVGSLPSVLKERLINEWHPMCAVCDNIHLEPVATMRLLKERFGIDVGRGESGEFAEGEVGEWELRRE